MNHFINNLERKFGKYAIKRLPFVILITYAVGYLMQWINPEIIYTLSLNPYAILHGQVWRLISWVLIPPAENNIFFLLIMLYFYYSLSSTLEQTWGTFYFNYYIFTGILFTIVGAFGLYGFSEFIQQDVVQKLEQVMTIQYHGECPKLYGGSYYYLYSSLYFSTYYINMSIFLAFAATYPDVRVMLFFILPIKVKVMGIVYAIILVVEAFQLGVEGLFVIGASLLNFIIFFISTRKGKHRSMKQIKRQREFKRKVSDSGYQHIAKHKCAICGRTNESNPELEFRFCSKCEGNYEFCQEHLFSHKHFTR